MEPLAPEPEIIDIHIILSYLILKFVICININQFQGIQYLMTHCKLIKSLIMLVRIFKTANQFILKQFLKSQSNMFLNLVSWDYRQKYYEIPSKYNLK